MYRDTHLAVARLVYWVTHILDENAGHEHNNEIDLRVPNADF